MKYVLQHGWILKTYCQRTSHRRPDSIWFHLYEMFNVSNSIQIESRSVVVWAGLGGVRVLEGWGMTAYEYMVSFWGSGNIWIY